MNQVFEKQLELSDLPKNKLDATTVANLVSLVSTINRNVSAEEIALIKEEGRREAESDIAELSVNEVADLRSSQWTIEEKLILLWATEYAKLKFMAITL